MSWSRRAFAGLLLTYPPPTRHLGKMGKVTPVWVGGGGYLCVFVVCVSVMVEADYDWLQATPTP